MMLNNIVVLTFHSVTNFSDVRPWSFLSTSVEAFEQTLKYLKKHNYLTITLKELYEWKKDKTSDEKKRVLLHFDDGFLDNYTIVYPMLKKYGFKASVFISPEFVDPRPILRELQYENIISGKKVKRENVWGYMSWNELRRIDSEGVIDVQAHALTHTWYACENKVIDFHHPNDNFYWLSWNKFPESKPFWLTEYDETNVPYGFPILRYAKSLSGKQYFMCDEAISFCTECLSKSINVTGTEKKALLDSLNEILKKKFGDRLGRYETDDEFKERVKKELIESKKTAEEKLGKKIDFLVWPGGAISDVAKDIAKEAGYLSFTKKGCPYNSQNDDLGIVYRVGGWSGLKFNGKPNLLLEKLFIKMQLHRGAGNRSIINVFYALLGKIYRLKNITKCRRNGEVWK